MAIYYQNKKGVLVEMQDTDSVFSIESVRKEIGAFIGFTRKNYEEMGKSDTFIDDKLYDMRQIYYELRDNPNSDISKDFTSQWLNRDIKQALIQRYENEFYGYDYDDPEYKDVFGQFKQHSGVSKITYKDSDDAIMFKASQLVNKVTENPTKALIDEVYSELLIKRDKVLLARQKRLAKQGKFSPNDFVKPKRSGTKIRNNSKGGLFIMGLQAKVTRDKTMQTKSKKGRKKK